MSVESHRSIFSQSKAKLKRARWIYSGLIKKACDEDRTGLVLPECARRAVAAGLYASTTGEKSVRFSLVRMFWKRTPEYHFAPFGWHCFYRDMGYVSGHFRKKPIMKVSAA